MGQKGNKGGSIPLTPYIMFQYQDNRQKLHSLMPTLVCFPVSFMVSLSMPTMFTTTTIPLLTMPAGFYVQKQTKLVKYFTKNTMVCHAMC